LLNLPNYRQQKESDCLAACAAMMLRDLEIEVPYPELLSILDVAPWVDLIAALSVLKNSCPAFM
jgi:hypothetical protein